MVSSRRPSTLPFRLYKGLRRKPLREEATVREKFQSRRHREAKIRGQSLFGTPPDGEVPLEGFSIDTAAISTAIFISCSHEEGVVLHRGSGLYRCHYASQVSFTYVISGDSLSHVCKGLHERDIFDLFLPEFDKPWPIYATVDAVVDFAEQFTRLEAENAQLRKTVKSSADQVLEANRLATDAKKENALLKEEVSKLKQQMKDEQDARRAAAVAIDKKEGVLRESIKDLLEAANITVTRRHQLREDSTSDALSLAAESNVQVLGLLQKTRGALSRLYSMIFPKVKQDKTLGEMADAFLVDPSEPVEVLKRRSRLFGAVLTFQLLMGHGLESDLEKLSKALPVDDDNHLVDLEPFKRSAITCANQLLELVDGAQAKPTPEAAPGPSSAPP
ncbi:hypothetical protein QYE76_049115 [Lolium multiflorum]|uniref:Uncharacterized protein n=1 Tax=Lolium multiflorum TaxID=4521 RepID=A0AAD8WGK0_LOLMU|nr:hypothetical protein QYE76_049115 [Lolium multiflorum]